MSRVTTEQGVVEGLELDGLHFFRNIPYAAPPFGELRFRPPGPPASWSGVRDATRPGPAPPQPADGNPLAAIYNPADTGEDCLTLEIWTPDPGSACLPVMVHIHGGGFVGGSGSVPGYSGRTFARDGVVHVGINYRLGIEGFLYLGDSADNLGLRDQIAALEWVRDNIGAFGGDADKVTIFGQSAGGISILNHLCMPGSRGLFARAIAQSANPAISVDPDEAQRITRQVARGLGVPATVEGLASVPVSRTVAATPVAMRRFARGLVFGDHRALLFSPFRVVHGTPTVPNAALDTVRSSTGQPDIPLLTGTTRNESAELMLIVEQAGGAVRPLIRRGVQRALHIDRALREGYRDGPRHITDSAAVVEAVWTDFALRIPTIRFVEARGAPSWLYEFRWQAETKQPLRGSCHGSELPFVRDDLAVALETGQPGYHRFGAEPPQKLAAAMHGAWVRFAVYGEPGWPRYETGSRATMVFDTSCEVVDDAAGAERRIWEGHSVDAG